MSDLSSPLLLLLAFPPPARPAAKQGLEGAQELFRQNHWEEARVQVRSHWDSIPEKERPAATFLIGRSYAREAELYGALRTFGAEVGLAYLEELGAARANRTVALIPLFKGLYQTEADRNAEAERTLGSKFDVREFHDVVLRDGVLPLALLHEQVEQYVHGAH